MAGLSILSVVAVAVLLQHTDAGVSFVRWGRTVCPSGTYTLYKGYMAGSRWNAGGGGAGYHCLVQEPKFTRPRPGRQGVSGLIYGVEFDYVDNMYGGLFSSENIPGGAIMNNDMVCVVCYVEGSYDKLVIPGTQDCAGTGYDLQYKGFMVSEWTDSPQGRSRGEFVCLDEAPEARPGGNGDDNQAIIFPVEVACGSLPCSPYVDGYELPCAVCTY